MSNGIISALMLQYSELLYSSMHFVSLHCNPFCHIALYYVALHCIAMYFVAMHFVTVQCLQQIALYCIMLKIVFHVGMEVLRRHSLYLQLKIRWFSTYFSPKMSISVLIKGYDKCHL